MECGGGGKRNFLGVQDSFHGEVSLVSTSSEDAIEIVVSLFTAEVHEKSVSNDEALSFRS